MSTEQTKKKIIDHQDVASDRISLVNEANRFVVTMMMRRDKPWLETPYQGENEGVLTPTEEEAYNACLNFLTNTFQTGAEYPRIYKGRVEEEVKLTIKDDDPEAEDQLAMPEPAATEPDHQS